jgi:SAM-dependent methyltransferase
MGLFKISNTIKMNDYDILSESYIKSHEKADKKFSMLPTALSMFFPYSESIVLDIGCGDGFFTNEFAKQLGVKKVIGIDNSIEQITKASSQKVNFKANYVLSDMGEFQYPNSDIIFAPFVLGYLESKNNLKSLFNLFYHSLSKGGSFGSIIDTPNSLYHDMTKFGSVKRMVSLKEGSQFEIDLYKENKLLTTLHSFYHKKDTIEMLLKEVGFSEVGWVNPIISQQGLELYGKTFWEEYLSNVDVSYFVAKK